MTHLTVYHYPGGEFDLAEPPPPEFFAEASVLRRLGRGGYYRALGGTFVEFRFPSGRIVARVADDDAVAAPDERRMIVAFYEPLDEFSAERILV